MPSFNEITGSRISSGAHKENTDYEKFSSGWDAIFGNKAVRQMTYPVDFGNGWVALEPVKITETTARVSAYTESTRASFMDVLMNADLYEGGRGVLTGPTREDEDWFFHPNDD